MHASFPFGNSSAKRSFTDRLRRKIGRKSFSMQLRDRKATPIYRDTLRHGQRTHQSGGVNHHAAAHVAQLERVQESQMFNDSRKHRAAVLPLQSLARIDEYSERVAEHVSNVLP